MVDSHRLSIKHTTNLSILSSIDHREKEIVKLMDLDRSEFKDKLIMAFTAADIPLKKLRCKEVIDLFEYMGFKLPSESSARSYILNHFANKNFIELKIKVKGQKIFLTIDESEIKKRDTLISWQG